MNILTITIIILASMSSAANVILFLSLVEHKTNYIHKETAIRHLDDEIYKLSKK